MKKRRNFCQKRRKIGGRWAEETNIVYNSIEENSIEENIIEEEGEEKEIDTLLSSPSVFSSSPSIIKNVNSLSSESKVKGNNSNSENDCFAQNINYHFENDFSCHSDRVKRVEESKRDISATLSIIN